MKQKTIGIIIAIELMVVILVPLFTINRIEGRVSETENRVLRSFPAVLDANGNLRPNYLSEFDDWFKDNIGLREPMRNLCGIVDYNLMHKSASPKVELGKEGWLYYTEENNVDIAKGTYPDFTDEEMETICSQIEQVRKKLESQGKEFVFVIPPSKASIHPEYIESADCQVMETQIDRFADYLEAHTDVKVVRLKDALLEEKSKSEEPLFFKTDTHWNYHGRYVGYKTIIEDMNGWGLIDSQPIEANFYEDGPKSGDLAKLMGAVNLSGDKMEDDSFSAFELKEHHAIEMTSGDWVEDFYKLLDSENVYYNGKAWENDAKKDAPTILWYGDSMMASGKYKELTGEGIMEYIAEHFSETWFIWSYEIKQDDIDYVEPDIVVLDISERGFRRNLPGLFDEFLKEGK